MLNFNRMFLRAKLVLGALVVLMAGCTSTDPVRVEQDFGNSVRRMVEAQTYNPAAAAHPPAEPPQGYDGAKAKRVIETYRGDVSVPQEVVAPSLIEILR